MKLGYACINLTLPTKFKTCRLKTVETEGICKVKDLTLHNLSEVLRAVKWNADHGILMYRISSDIIPFASHEITNDWIWWEDTDVLRLAKEIKEVKHQYHMRFSCHPGQYTLLNSPREEVVLRSLEDLMYHNLLMDLLEGQDMILHVGGAYGDKVQAKERFIQAYNQLPTGIKDKLRLENDHTIFTISDVVEISSKCGVPICFDIHHSNCNPPIEPVESFIPSIIRSWDGYGRPKTHISSGRNSKTDPAHHDYILEEDFEAYCNILKGYEVDMMFEAKKKEQAVLRMMNWIQKTNKETEFHIEGL
ncbi:UV DNA damage repair endonuclease UvsE [Heyndrickxia acidicola]|uniref:UV DNA damage repair endonuclease UvsE n=1 Tax=Heyndrickxia acidicola TaxID=209389 RepID=A0ABU6MHZ9_9BACI|nr:UV DNA damage repair endonuclease UvsE [Heyndrickxia acidicola]MED1204022.1 UV DNA damage repair endonuclease UvsE [Heyndrickxia acidicola]